MRRREFIGFCGGAAAAWPFAARAQKAERPPTVGFLGMGTAAGWSPWVAAFLQRLRELGWIDGRTITIEYRWAEGHAARLAEMAAEFVQLKVDVIVTQGTSPVLAAKQATSSIPIVFASAGDPVGTGLVASLARPGGNVTGLSSQMADTATKRLELLREILPALRKLAIMTNDENPFAVQEASEVRSVAGALGLEVTTTQVRRAEDIDPAFEALRGRADAIYVITDPQITNNRLRINSLAIAARLPTIYGNRESVEAGGLISYGASFPDQFRRTAEYVDRILRGARPQDIPVEQPTKFELVLNLKSAKALGLAVPSSVLTRADEVIE
jgi:putative tryptophan/tyrosine transport system substrate-binding protein